MPDAITPSKADNESFRVPRLVAFSVLLALPTMIFTGAWYMATQASDARHLAEDLVAIRLQIADRQTDAEKASRESADALGKLSHEQTDLIRGIDSRLTRMESQMSFFVGTNSDGSSYSKAPRR